MLPTNLKELLHNKLALAGVGVAGAAGVYMLIKRRGASSGASTGASTGTQVTGAGTPYTFDTTSSDVGEYLSSFSAGEANQLQGYLDQITGVVNQLKQTPTDTTPSPAQHDYDAPAGVSVPGWIRGLQAAGVDVTYDQIAQQINPDIHWGGNNRNNDTFINPITVHIPTPAS